MAHNLQTVEARAKLTPRRSPYWHRISTGCQVGFRKMTNKSPGSWWAQIYVNRVPQDRHPLGTLDHLPQSQRFDEAKRQAESMLAHVGRGGVPQDVTVRMACENYVEHLRAEGKAATAKDAEARFKRWVYGDSLANQSLRKLAALAVRAWRHQLMAKPVVVNPHAEEKRTRERASSTVNRDMTSLRAALNLARDNGAVDSDAGWRTALRSVESANGRRTLYLTKDQRASLIKHADKDVAAFLRGLSLLPLRPGALASLTVAQFDPQLQVLIIGRDKAGAERNVPLPPHAAKFFSGLAADRPPAAHLLTRADGKPWTKDAWKKPIKAAALAAKLPAETTAYTLRHSVITDLIVGGLDTLTVARVAGTSLAMIDKHYGHLQAKRAVAALAKLSL